VDGLPFVVDWNSGRDDLLVCVDQGVDDRRQSWVVCSEGDGGDGGDSACHGLQQLALLDVQNFGAERVTLLVDLDNLHAVGEGRDVQHVQQCCLGSTDFGAGLDELEIGRDFNGTTGNLGGNTKGLEERGLSGFHASVAGWDVDIKWGDGTSSSWSCDLVGEDLVSGLLEFSVGEDEADVACTTMLA